MDLTAGTRGIVKEKRLQAVAQNFKWESSAASIVDEIYKIWMGYIWHDTCERDVVGGGDPHTHTHTQK